MSCKKVGLDACAALVEAKDEEHIIVQGILDDPKKLLASKKLPWCLCILARNPDSELFATIEKRQPTNFYQVILKLACYV